MNEKLPKYKRDGVEPMTLQEVADTMEISRERVRQIEAKALAKLKRALFRDGYTSAEVLTATDY